MHLLFITQKVDRADWLLGFTHGWLKALAGKVDRLTIICLEQGETELPSNVRVISLGKERGARSGFDGFHGVIDERGRALLLERSEDGRDVGGHSGPVLLGAGP